MSARRLLDLGSGTLRVVNWRDRDDIAHLTPYGRRAFAPAGISQVLDQLRSEGFERVVTSALAADEQAPFLACGFEPRHRLVLLSRRLDVVDPPPTVALQRGRRRDRATALAIDRAAFSGFWRLDRAGLDDALSATPASRFRLAVVGRPVAYAICGRAGDTGYVQRLAVEPASHRQGVGRALVLDGLRWMARHGARTVYVNTADDNQGAIDFYTRLGFDVLPDGLAVLECALDAHDRT